MGRVDRNVAIIAIDTAAGSLTLAVGQEDGRLLADYTTHVSRQHATLLHPLLDEMLAAVSQDIRDVTAVIVGVGPGSYTGVRIGVTAAKALAVQLGIPVIPVSSLTAAAYGVRVRTGYVMVSWDARRGEAYTGLYRSDGHVVVAMEPEGRLTYGQACAVLVDHWEREPDPQVRAGGVALLGDGAAAMHELCADRAPQMRADVIEGTSSVKGASLYQLGMEVWNGRSGEEGDDEERAHALVPRYLRLAEAETRLRPGGQGSGQGGQ